MNDVSPLSKSVDELVQILTQGGVIIYPTDTLVGIGCRADREAAVKRIFTIKKRPLDQLFPILVASKARAREVVSEIPPHAEVLMDTYWPGALTILMPAKESAAIGIRQPNHPKLLELLKKCSFPIIGTSANIHGKKPVSEMNDVDPLIMGQIDGLLEGEGGCGVESTIVDCTVDPWIVVRKGVIDLG